MERAARYVQSNALQGKPFESLQAVNYWLEHWSLTYADERILDDYLKEIRTPREWGGARNLDLKVQAL